MSLAASYWLALGCLLAFLALLYGLLGPAKPSTSAPAKSPTSTPPTGTPAPPPVTEPRPFWHLIVGTDNRVSTSKVQFALWTLALAYALLVIAFHRFELPPGNLDPRYLLLLGFPAGAAVSAKAITSQKASQGTIAKTRAQSSSVADIVTNDAGELDLGDTQYFLFNLVALTAFFIAFFHNPVTLPALSDTLVALTSGSAAAYVAKKAASGTPVAISAVSPQKGAPNSRLSIYGTNLCAGRQSSENPQVTVGGLIAPVDGTAQDSRVDVFVPATTVASTDELQVEVVTPSGQAACLPKAFVVSS
jgi:hypothetical protein